MDGKFWLTSKTMWLNGLALIATVATAFGLDLGLTETVRVEIVVGVLAVINLVLRMVTTKPVTATKEPQS